MRQQAEPLKAALARTYRHAIPALMPDERTSAALDRIERAFARIEAASADLSAGSLDGRELEQLRQAHQALRSRVEGAISHIDELLASRVERVDG